MIQRCFYCAHEGELVFVHGHYQCANCRCNIIPCCDGSCPDEYLNDTLQDQHLFDTEAPKVSQKKESVVPGQYALFD